MIEHERFYDEMGRLIKEKRLSRGINQEILADRLGLTRASVINLEKGRHRPSVYQLMIISDLLQVNYTELIPSYKQSALERSGDTPNIDNAITDQDGIDESTQTVLINFLNSLKS